MAQYYLALDLKPNDALIAQYEAYHKDIWPEIKESIYASGITNMQIFRVENRLFMIITANENFSFEEKSKADINNEKVQSWENLMSTFQQLLPNTPEGTKWRLMDKIFEI